MSGLIQGRNQSFIINPSDNTVDWVLAGRIDNREVLAEIAENRAEKTECVGDDDIDSLLMAVITDD